VGEDGTVLKTELNVRGRVGDLLLTCEKEGTDEFVVAETTFHVAAALFVVLESG
jgi:hypothetical protein